MFVDSHCHIDFPELRERLPELVANMAAQQVTHALCISVTLEDFPNVLQVAHSYPNIYATAGVHPDYPDMTEPTVDQLVALAQDPKVVAIGETGLDYYRLEGDLQWQRDRFAIHIAAARQTGLPLIIHTRSASADTLKIMAEQGAEHAGGVMHCFTETLDVALASIEMGFYISFSGIVTFKNAKDLQATAKALPLDRLLIETDSPYLAPVPYRGRTNEPSYVPHVAQMLAQLRGQSVESIAQATTDNFFKLFSKVPRSVSTANSVNVN